MAMAGIFFILQLCVQVVLSFVVTETANVTSVLEAGVTVDMVRATEGPILKFQNNSVHVTPSPQPNPHTFPGELTPRTSPDPQLPPGELTPRTSPDPQLPPGELTPRTSPDPQLPPGELTPPTPPDSWLPPGDLTPPTPPETPLFPTKFPPDFYDYFYGEIYGDSSKFGVYMWDKEKMSAKDFQLSYCPLRCKNGESRSQYINDIVFNCATVKCFDCSCEKPACEIYGNCCPDISEPVFTLEPIEESPAIVETSTQAEIFELPKETDNISKDERKNSTLFGENIWSTESDFQSPPGNADIQNEVTNTNASYDYVPKSVCNTNSYFNFLYIRSCPRNFANQTVVALCEGEVVEEKLNIDYMARVYDERTSVTYYNQYCAICNGVTQFLTWEIRLDCSQYMFVYQATNMDEFLNLAFKPESSCTVNHDLPPNPYADYHYCPGYFNSETIDRCNTTGQWQDYDLDVLQACEGPELSSRIHRVRTNESEPVYYKNIFCAICNTGEYPKTSRCNEDATPRSIPIKTPPFSLLLGFRREGKVRLPPFIFPRWFSFSKCGQDEWAAPDGSCVPLHCSPGKTFSDGMCRTALGDIIIGLGYRLRVWFVLDGGEGYLVPGKVSQIEINFVFLAIFVKMNYLFQSLGSTTEYILESGWIYNVSELLNSDGQLPPFMPPDSDFASNIMKRSVSDTEITEASSTGANSDTMSLHFWIDGVLQADRNTTRDDFETLIADTFLNNEIDVDVMGQFNITLKPHVIAYDYERNEHCSEALSVSPYVFCDSLELVSELHFLNVKDASKFLNVTNVLNCRYVRFNSTQYDMETDRTVIPPHTTVRIDLNVTVVNISDHTDLSQLTVDPDGHLLVCHTLLDKKLTEIEEDRKRRYTAKLSSTSSSDDSTKGQYILTLVCMGASMLCLLLTLVTYFRFSVLRSVAGRNNIFLCGSLLLAQALLLATSHVEGPSTLCTAIGISTHFLWLCMFSWSFICCFHMFRVFTAKTRSSHASSHSNMMLLVRNVALSLLFPSLVVVAVVLGSYFTSHGHQIGYGDNACYLDSALLVGISTVAPLALVTLCNIIFFMVTIIKIHNVRKLQQSTEFKKEDRRDLYIYIKLSTMTGAFWTIFIVAEAVDVDALRYIAIVLNGLQGVFIFISYICNKRVVNLYLRSCGRAPLTTTSSEGQFKTDRSTLGKLASQIHRETRGKENEDISPDLKKKNGSLQTTNEEPDTCNDFDDIENKEDAERNGGDGSFSSHGYHSDISGPSDEKNNVYDGDEEEDEKPQRNKDLDLNVD